MTRPDASIAAQQRALAELSRRRLLGLGLTGLGLLATSPVLAACSADSASTGGTASGSGKGAVLRYGRTTGPKDLDPSKVILSGDVYTLNQIFETLFVTAPDGTLTPHLATGHTVSADGKTYTIPIRTGVTFSDGSPMTAHDVVYSILRNRDGDGPLSFLNAIIADAKAGDDHTVVFTLKQAWTPFLSDLTAFSNSIVPKDLGGKKPADFFAAPVGTGPFTLKSWTKGGTVVLARNAKYWQPGKPALAEVHFTVISDDNQLVQQLQGGQVDVIDDVPPASVAALRANPAVSVIAAKQWSVDLLFFNTKVPQFADVHVRRAISHAVDQAHIVKATTFGTAEPATSFFPPSLQYFDGSVKTASFDLAAAKAELARSAYPKGFATTILVPSSNQAWNATAQILQQALRPLGITLTIRSIEIAAYKKAFEAFDFDMFVNNAINDISDPDEMASFQVDDVEGGSHSYWTHYHNPAAIELVHAAQREQDTAKRGALYARLQQIVADDVPYVPLTYPAMLKATSAKVKGLTVNPAGAVRLAEVSLG